MDAKWYQKLALCILFAALTAGGIEFYKTFVAGAQAEMDKGIKDRNVLEQ